jgi:hypothetical protein
MKINPLASLVSSFRFHPSVGAFMSLFQQPANLRFFSGMALLAIFGAPQADLWPKWQNHDPASARKIDHSVWDTLLKKISGGAASFGDQPIPLRLGKGRGSQGAKGLSRKSPKLAGFGIQPDGAKGLLDQPLQRVNGGGGLVPLSGFIHSGHRHLSGVVQPGALGCQASNHRGRKAFP